MAAKKKASEVRGVHLAMRLTDAERARLAKVAARFELLGESTVARVAMLLGLDAIERDPSLIMGGKPKKR